MNPWNVPATKPDPERPKSAVAVASAMAPLLADLASMLADTVAARTVISPDLCARLFGCVTEGIDACVKVEADSLRDPVAPDLCEACNGTGTVQGTAVDGLRQIRCFHCDGRGSK